MTAARAISCPTCGAPLTFGSPFCAWCRSPISWGRDVAIERGDPYFGFDFSRDALPGAHRTFKRDTLGTRLDVEKPDWELYGLFAPKVRDACLVVSGVALDDHGYLGVYARLHREGDGYAGYKLKVCPRYRSWALVRDLWWSTHSQNETILPWEFTTAIAGVGEPNEVELRFADSVLQVSLNGRRVVTVVDASYGFGGLGWVAGSLDQPASVTFRSAAAYRAK